MAVCLAERCDGGLCDRTAHLFSGITTTQLQSVTQVHVWLELLSSKHVSSPSTTIKVVTINVGSEIIPGLVVTRRLLKYHVCSNSVHIHTKTNNV
jgi:hypothetical protein